MKRRLYNCLVVASLLCCLGFSALWIYSCWYDDLWYLSPVPGNSDKFAYFTAGSREGDVEFTWGTHDRSGLFAKQSVLWRLVGFRLYLNGNDLPPSQSYHGRVVPIDPAWAEMGDFVGGLRPRSWLTIPDWFLVLLGLPLPVLWFLRRRGKKLHFAERHCLNCGYDLRASRDRCPECGTPIPANSPKISG